MKKLLSALLLPMCIAAQGQTITAKSWAVADDTHIIQSKNITEQRSIGSITKLMTVMVVLDAHQDLDEKLKPYTRRELIQLALVKSDNTAAKRLCEQFPGGYNECVWAMNNKASVLGLANTHFIEPTGLSVFNVSTVEDLIRLVSVARRYPEIVQASRTAHLNIAVKKRVLIVKNTNPIVAQHPEEFWVSKTGFINAAGGCIVMMKDTPAGLRTVVVLGSRNTRTRIPEAETILALK